MKTMFILLLSVCFLNSACAGTEPVVEKGKGRITTVDSTAPPTAPTAGGLPTTEIKIDVLDVDSRQVLKMFFEVAKLKYDLPSSLPGKPISLKVAATPWAEGFNMVIASAGYDYLVDEAGKVHVTTVQIKKSK